MRPTNPFLVKFASPIIAVLGGLDRVLFKGYLHDAGLGYSWINHLGPRGPRTKSRRPGLVALSSQLV